MRILLVEPNKAQAQTYHSALKQSGHVVTWVQNAQKAIHAIDTNLPDVIVLELQMAKHNGIAFLYELRSYHDWQNIPVVIHSMVPKENLKSSEIVYESLGIADHLYKPTSPLSSLIDSVSKVLSQAA